MPEDELKQRLSSRAVTKLIAAERAGLLPDPWIQTAMICYTIATMLASDSSKIDLETFLVKFRGEVAQTAEQMEAGRQERMKWQS